MRKLILLCFLAITTLSYAQHKKKAFSKPKFGGALIAQYNYTGQENAKANTFNIRAALASLEGSILDQFDYKLQAWLNGNTSSLSFAPKMIDIYAEWRKYDFLKIKVGQGKVPFTFENPMHPIDQGFMSFAQNVSILANYADKTGALSSSGRDIGVQLQGDLIKNNKGRHLIHYQIGVFNGQGINTADVDQRKDIIGGAWVMPIKGLRIGAFGWVGSYARKGVWTDNKGETHNGVNSLSRYRYAISGEYVNKGWQVRSEYIHNTGYGFTQRHEEKADLNNAEVNYAAGNKSDGFYFLTIAPIKENKIQAKARYDLYRPQAEWNTSKTIYSAGADYFFTKNVKISAEYAFVNDRSLNKHNYNMFNIELGVKF